jgi:uncharacterized RDD family membrane protein YckC
MTRMVSRADLGFLGTRAGVVTRTIAAAIDLGTILTASLVLYFAVSGVSFILDPRGFRWPQLSAIRLFLVAEVMLFFYLAVGWMNIGRSVGKQIMGLRVLEAGGGRMRPWRALLRSAICTLFPVSLFWCAIDSGNRAVHDRLLGTIVVYDWYLRSLPSSHSREDLDEPAADGRDQSSPIEGPHAQPRAR